MRPSLSERQLIPALSALALVVASALFALRPAARELRGDEGTYVAMAASLARDLDLRFDEADRAWAEERGGVALILQRTPRGVVYSKPVLYPLLAAPFHLVAGDRGAMLVNLLALAAAFALALRVLAAGTDRRAARDLLLTFAATGLVIVYLPWRMTETLQVALALAGLALAFRATRHRDRPRGEELAGAALLGLLVSLREPNAIVAAAPVVAALVAGAPRRALRFAGAAAASYALVVALTWGLTGAANPYKAARATFNAETGYPAGEGAAAPLARFASTADLATSTLGFVPALDATKSAYAALYFLVGRHTGLLVYLPAVLLCFGVALGTADRAGRVALAAFAAHALFYLVWMPTNYFGGETFVGNRYILAAIPLPLVALGKWPSRRALLAVWAVAALVAGSALASVIATRAVDATSQSHASAGIFRLLPYESTASNLDGRRDRYWSGDFVRFVDPFAEVGPASFVLTSATPAAELEIAARRGAWSGAPIHFLAQAEAPGVELEISDYGERERHRLALRADGTAGGPLSFPASRAWRHHTFWWSPEEIYAVRTIRLRAVSAAAEPVRVRLRYLGRQPPPTSGFERAVTRLELSGDAIAGGLSEVELEVVNRGGFAWASTAALPVQVGVRIRSLDRPEEAALETRAPLPHLVRPGESFATTFPLRWPDRAGSYELTLDLVLEDVAWFAGRVGEPLARREVVVSPR